MRGALVGVLGVCEDLGIIPACAGSTFGGELVGEIRGDHPRMCGEHRSQVRLVAKRLGSSPHVRGALCCPRVQSMRLWDHPRMCGEHSEPTLPIAPRMGSSPHVRGAPPQIADNVLHPGIIPACAGSTWSLRSNFIRDRVSSPHVRGARPLPTCMMPFAGIIPACAGSTLKYLAFLGYSSAFSFGSQGSKLFTCVVFYPPNFRAL